jgi:hypothetical protein
MSTSVGRWTSILQEKGGRGEACDVDGRISDHWAHVVGEKKAKLGKSDACGIIEKYQIILYAICSWFGI